MRRIRLVFLLLAVLLLVSMGLLVQRALESVALERRVSHRALPPFAASSSQPYVTGYFQIDPVYSSELL